ncbi:hypothetical protein SAMN05444920_12678 [Nonomuraea solani]|uniref:Uncharacterized protein n=1 Tax=Nonomuraea solani TaxID=1144553 RepID=A0A1H6EWY1_9ACTN|nr:hypothetical protein [Nonomuraea solani]SEH02420.1 hypothetical protein SAMN05444920_12678 [Nonomuraea solani]
MSHPSIRLATDTTDAASASETITGPAADRPAATGPTPPHLPRTRPAPAEALSTGGLDADDAHHSQASDLLDAHLGLGGALPLDAAEHAFNLLMRGPDPLSADGALLGHELPARLIPLHELRAMLLHPSCSRTTRDHVWRHLIEQARTQRGAWMVAAVTLAIPMLRRLIAALADTIPAERMDREDLEADVLAAYMQALCRVNLTWSHPLLRLSRLTRIAVLRAHATGQPHPLADPDLTDRAEGGHQRTLAYPTGHPDLLLAQAVAQQIITEQEAELIAATRLEGIALSSYCRRRGLLYCTALKRRQRAETALHQALQTGELSSSL